MSSRKAGEMRIKPSSKRYVSPSQAPKLDAFARRHATKKGKAERLDAVIHRTGVVDLRYAGAHKDLSDWAKAGSTKGTRPPFRNRVWSAEEGRLTAEHQSRLIAKQRNTQRSADKSQEAKAKRADASPLLPEFRDTEEERQRRKAFGSRPMTVREERQEVENRDLAYRKGRQKERKELDDPAFDHAARQAQMRSVFLHGVNETGKKKAFIDDPRGSLEVPSDDFEMLRTIRVLREQKKKLRVQKKAAETEAVRLEGEVQFKRVQDRSHVYGREFEEVCWTKVKDPLDPQTQSQAEKSKDDNPPPTLSGQARWVLRRTSVGEGKEKGGKPTPASASATTASVSLDLRRQTLRLLGEASQTDACQGSLSQCRAEMAAVSTMELPSQLMQVLSKRDISFYKWINTGREESSLGRQKRRVLPRDLRKVAGVKRRQLRRVMRLERKMEDLYSKNMQEAGNEFSNRLRRLDTKWKPSGLGLGGPKSKPRLFDFNRCRTPDNAETEILHLQQKAYGLEEAAVREKEGEAVAREGSTRLWRFLSDLSPMPEARKVLVDRSGPRDTFTLLSVPTLTSRVEQSAHGFVERGCLARRLRAFSLTLEVSHQAGRDLASLGKEDCENVAECVSVDGGGRGSSWRRRRIEAFVQKLSDSGFTLSSSDTFWLHRSLGGNSAGSPQADSSSSGGVRDCDYEFQGEGLRPLKGGCRLKGGRRRRLDHGEISSSTPESDNLYWKRSDSEYEGEGEGKGREREESFRADLEAFIASHSDGVPRDGLCRLSTLQKGRIALQRMERERVPVLRLVSAGLSEVRAVVERRRASAKMVASWQPLGDRLMGVEDVAASIGPYLGMTDTDLTAGSVMAAVQAARKEKGETVTQLEQELLQLESEFDSAAAILASLRARKDEADSATRELQILKETAEGVKESLGKMFDETVEKLKSRTADMTAEKELRWRLMEMDGFAKEVEEKEAEIQQKQKQAVATLERQWVKFRSHREKRASQARDAAALRIQLRWRISRRERRARLIQRNWRRKKGTDREVQEAMKKAAGFAHVPLRPNANKLIPDPVLPMPEFFVEYRHVKGQTQAAVKVQSRFRGRKAQSAFHHARTAAVKIQRSFRAHKWQHFCNIRKFGPGFRSPPSREMEEGYRGSKVSPPYRKDDGSTHRPQKGGQERGPAWEETSVPAVRIAGGEGDGAWVRDWLHGMFPRLQ
uniref:Uncharacterized protein n=1 Tax=Chromera velia CCMP2878 TaxID=1169474 RepID=A0A0G4IB97_9ALVE|eukprot:Cvel_12800.t1-p1 / transcript=Cvel_12800.t1 / gene=Cvel_12800 / organism=Chromera_velia_CCMP2878 / gene_product=hypothetical protein / transcript_product=hypothetical protein / location=Cvel_scaffold852:31607-35581(+) / protein_length=1198 / sequence_SO=supercontig / SO=protein_coding / is_pseudo=false